MAQLPRLNSPKIAYLIKCFPRLSETFILHEVLELKRQGVSLRIFSLTQPEGKVNQATQEVQAQISYIPRGFPFGTLRLLEATGKRLLKSPWRFLRTVLIAIVKYHHLATPRHLLYAAYLANELEREGITHIHAHYVNTPATVANLAHHFTGISYSFTAHAKDIYLSRKASIAHKMQQASFVATCTAYNQRYLTEQIDQAVKTPVYGIYHGLNLRVFPALPVPAARQDSPPLILTVARLVEKKGLTYLLQACRVALKRPGTPLPVPYRGRRAIALHARKSKYANSTSSSASSCMARRRTNGLSRCTDRLHSRRCPVWSARMATATASPMYWLKRSIWAYRSFPRRFLASRSLLRRKKTACWFQRAIARRWQAQWPACFMTHSCGNAWPPPASRRFWRASTWRVMSHDSNNSYLRSLNLSLPVARSKAKYTSQGGACPLMHQL